MGENLKLSIYGIHHHMTTWENDGFLSTTGTLLSFIGMFSTSNADIGLTISTYPIQVFQRFHYQPLKNLRNI